MDRLRRSLRDSFRKKKDHVPECSKPHQWQADEAAVRDGTCSFPVKYLGCVEVFESRGMQVCEEALKMLRNSRRRTIKGILYVTGDGLRVVDDDTKGLIVDQTIEKVSFCAPDRNHEKGFSYICRDGTTRRWMCHGFLAVKDSGERLSHAVGCAFAACLERKQKRDKECGVTMTFDPNSSTFTRMGSFKQGTLTERIQEAAETKPAVGRNSIPGPTDVPAAKPVHNPFAIERPHATPMMLQRQGSFRGFNQLNQTSPFKRQLSLRISDLPSNLERQQRSMSLESSEFSKPTSPVSPPLSPRAPRTRLHSLPNAVNMSPIPESSPVADKQPSDSISAMCQQLARGLTLLSNTDDPFSRPFGPTPMSAPPALSTGQSRTVDPSQAATTKNGVGATVSEQDPWAGGTSRAEAWLASSVSTTTVKEGVAATAVPPASAVNAVAKSASNPLDLFAGQFNERVSSAATVPLPLPPPGNPIMAPPRRAPHISHLRSQSLGAAEQHTARPHAASRTLPNEQTPVAGWSTVNGNGSSNGLATATSAPLRDPFDAEWAALAATRSRPNTNPFAQNAVKTFEVHM